MSELAETYLLIGGNIGDRWENLTETKNLISEHIGEIKNMSAVFETEPWGVTDQPWFLNQVLQVYTAFSPEELLMATKRIEDILQSRKWRQWGERAADVDILFYEDKIVELENLKIPHPQLHKRNFVLVPLNEVAAEKIHPIFQKSVAQLLDESEDMLVVKKAVRDEV